MSADEELRYVREVMAELDLAGMAARLGVPVAQLENMESGREPVPPAFLLAAYHVVSARLDAGEIDQ